MLATALETSPYGTLQDTRMLLSDLAGFNNESAADLPLPPVRPKSLDLTLSDQTTTPLDLRGTILADEALQGGSTPTASGDPAIASGLAPIYFADGSFGLAKTGAAGAAIDLYTHQGRLTDEVSEDPNGTIVDRSFDDNSFTASVKVASAAGTSITDADGATLNLGKGADGAQPATYTNSAGVVTEFAGGIGQALGSTLGAALGGNSLVARSLDGSAIGALGGGIGQLGQLRYLVGLAWRERPVAP